MRVCSGVVVVHAGSTRAAPFLVEWHEALVGLGALDVFAYSYFRLSTANGRTSLRFACRSMRESLLYSSSIKRHRDSSPNSA